MSDIATGTVSANGLDFTYLTAGPENGPLALLLHGFPDSPHTWRPLMGDLAAAGYRAVAPFMRGYAPTSVPKDGAYDTDTLAADAVALHESLGGGSDAVIIGHDWGAFATYGAAGAAPERWRRAVVMSVTPPAAAATAMLDYEQLKRFFYMFLFQTPIAELVLDRAFVEGLWRDWSPDDGRDRSHAVDRVMECLATPDNVAAAIGYYRAMLDPSRLAERLAAGKEEKAEAADAPPMLYLHGTEDGCLDVDLVAPGGDVSSLQAALPAGSRVLLVPGAGHFLQFDRPDDVAARILDWLR